MNTIRSTIWQRLISAALLALFSLPALAIQKVLVIESYHSGYSWDRDYLAGIHEVFNGEYEVLTFEMDTKRIPPHEYVQSADRAWQYYLKIQPDLVIIGDDNALRYLSQRFMNETTPVVFLGVNNNPRNYGVYYGGNITGVLERPLIKRNIFEMNKMLKADKVLVMYDGGTTAQVTLEEVFKGRSQIKLAGINVHLKLINSWEKWQQTVLTLEEEGYQAVYVGLYHTLTDASGTHIPAEQVVRWTSEHVKVPVFCFWDFTVGSDMTAGGLVLFGVEQGRSAAQIAKQILAGKPVSEIAITIGEKGQWLFSRTQLERFELRLHETFRDKARFVD